MGWWLLDPDGDRVSVGEDVATADDASLIALQMIILEGYDWVEVGCDEDPEWVTRWTAVERDEKGAVTKITVRESDGEVSGEVSVIDREPPGSMG